MAKKHRSIKNGVKSLVLYHPKPIDYFIGAVPYIENMSVNTACEVTLYSYYDYVIVIFFSNITDCFSVVTVKNLVLENIF